MALSIADQIALDDALVTPADRLKIGKCNLRLRSDITSKEATLQVVYEAVKKQKSGTGKQKTSELENISEADLTEAEQLKIVIKRSHQETHSSHASGSGADEGTGVTPGVPDAPDYDISWKSSDDDQDDEQDQEDDDARDADKKAEDDDDEEMTESDNDGDD
ncbi:hypothetical protein Tco_0027751, partial [Tanacetum coccineum]